MNTYVGLFVFKSQQYCASVDTPTHAATHMIFGYMTWMSLSICMTSRNICNLKGLDFTYSFTLDHGVYEVYTLGVYSPEVPMQKISVGKDNQTFIPLPKSCQETKVRVTVNETSNVSVLMSENTIRTTFRRSHPIQTSPNIAVVIPLKDCEAYIGRCLQSLNLQTMKPSVVYIVDDGSVDNSLKVAKATPVSFPITFIRNKVSVGPFLSKNMALARCLRHHDIITLLDSDDYIAHDAYETLYAILKKNPDAIGVYPHCIRLEGPCLKPFSTDPSTKRRSRKCFAGLFTHAETFERFGFFECVRYGSDGEFNARLENIGEKDAILTSEYVSYFAECRKDSLTQKYKVDLDESHPEWLHPSRIEYSKRFSSANNTPPPINIQKNIPATMEIFKTLRVVYLDDVYLKHISQTCVEGIHLILVIKRLADNVDLLISEMCLNVLAQDASQVLKLEDGSFGVWY